jgi:hypothetical protein
MVERTGELRCAIAESGGGHRARAEDFIGHQPDLGIADVEVPTTRLSVASYAE